MIGMRFRGEIKLLLNLSTLATSTANSIAARTRFKLGSSRSRTTHRAFTVFKLNGIDGTGPHNIGRRHNIVRKIAIDSPMFAYRYRCPECRSRKTNFWYPDNFYSINFCRECGIEFRKTRAAVWAFLSLFVIFSLLLLFTIVSHIPLGVL